MVFKLYTWFSLSLHSAEVEFGKMTFSSLVWPILAVHLLWSLFEIIIIIHKLFTSVEIKCQENGKWMSSGTKDT